MKIKTTLLCISAALISNAQGLNQEITIDKEIVPEQRAATRLDVSHSILSPVLPAQNLSVSERDLGINSDIYHNPVNPVFDFNNASQNRGYLSAGFFPTINANIAAGYKFICNKNTSLAAALFYSGAQYDQKTPFEIADDKVKDHNFDISLNLSHKFSNTSRLNIATGFGIASAQYHYYDEDKNFSPETNFYPDLYKSGNTHFFLNGDYTALAGDLTYSIGANFAIHSNSTDDEAMPYLYHTSLPELDGISEKAFSICADVKNNNSGLNLSASFLNYNNFNSYDTYNTNNYVFNEGKTTGIVTAKPYYLFENELIKAKIGLKAEISVNSGKKFHLAPDIRIDALFHRHFTAYTKITGGLLQNSLSALYSYSHFLNPLLAYENSNMPLDASVGLIFGPLKGSYLKVYGGYTYCDDYLILAGAPHTNYLTYSDIKQWYGGAEAQFSFRNIFDINAQYVINPAEYRRDQASAAASIALTIKPLDRLSVSPDYTYVIGRKQLYCNMLETGAFYPEHINNRSLGNFSSLNISALYSFTGNFSAFISLKNILAHDNVIAQDLMAQKFHGLAGINIKF